MPWTVLHQLPQPTLRTRREESHGADHDDPTRHREVDLSEACATSDHWARELRNWARELRKLGHDVRLMPPAGLTTYRLPRAVISSNSLSFTCTAVRR